MTVLTVENSSVSILHMCPTIKLNLNKENKQSADKREIISLEIALKFYQTLINVYDQISCL